MKQLCGNCPRYSLGKCSVVGKPTLLMTECPDDRWPKPEEPPIKVLWLSGDMSQGGCTRYSREIIRLLKEVYPLEVEIVYFQEHFYDPTVHQQLRQLCPAELYDPATFQSKVEWADIVTSVNMNPHIPVRSTVLAQSAHKLFCQVHGTCPYTKSICDDHRPYTRYYLGCSSKAVTLLEEGDTYIFPPAPIDWNRVVRRRPKKEAKLRFCGKDVPIVTYAGRLAHDKNIDQMAADLNQLSPEVHLLVVGDGYQGPEIIPRLQSMLGSRLILKPWVDHPTDYMDATDVFMCLSDHEGLPTTVIECLMHGTTVVANNSGISLTYEFKTEGFRPMKACWEYKGPETIAEALAYPDSQRIRESIMEMMRLEHSHSRIQEMWWAWLKKLKNAYKSR